MTDRGLRVGRTCFELNVRRLMYQLLIWPAVLGNNTRGLGPAFNAEDYLKAYPHGQYSFEPRFRIAERLQKRGEYAEAIKQYQQVSGNPSYDFTAVFNAAECNYLMVAKAEQAPEAAGKNAKPSPALTAPPR